MRLTRRKSRLFSHAGLATIFTLLALTVRPAFALSPDELLLVVNKNVPESTELAEFYAKTREVPSDHIVALDLPTTEQMAFDTYETNVVPPLRAYIQKNDPTGHIKCLVTFYGVPFRVAGRIERAEEKNEIKVLQDQLKATMDRIGTLVTDAEAVAATNDNKFKPLVVGSPMADPQSSVALDNDGRRLEHAGQAVMQIIGRMPEGEQKEFTKSQLLAIVNRVREAIPNLSEFDTTQASSQPASSQATTSAAAINAAPTTAQAQQDFHELEDRRFDPTARRTLRQLAAMNGGSFNYAKLLMAQIGYLSSADSEASTDSELSLLKLVFYPRVRWQLNTLNYRLGTGPTQAMMVSRLDAPDAKIVKQMIVDSLRGEMQGLKGKVVIDSRGISASGDAKDAGYAAYDATLRNLAAIVHLKTKLPLVFDEQEALLPPHSQTDVALYVGWYSPGQYVPSCNFVPGAVGFHIGSWEMISLRDPGNNGWVKGLLKDGVAATLGPVSEPYVQSFPLADEFFPLLLTGKLTLAEVYWKTELMSSWRQCLVGDPLYTPYKTNPPLKPTDLSPRLQFALPLADRPTTMPAAVPH